MGLVIDASVVGSWFFRDEQSAYADAVLVAVADAGTTVPSVWPYEVTNMFTLAERRGRISAEDVATAHAAIQSLPLLIRQPHPPPALPGLARVARAFRLTAYDAAYLELAMQTRSTLATLDEALDRAATQAGVQLFSS